MYLTAKRYDGVIDLTLVGKRIGDGLAGMVGGLPGFVSFYSAEAEDNVLVMASVFDTQATAEDAERLAVVWASENIGFLLPNYPQITAGEVTATSRRLP